MSAQAKNPMSPEDITKTAVDMIAVAVSLRFHISSIAVREVVQDLFEEAMCLAVSATQQTEREACARLIEARCAEVLAKQTPGAPDLSFDADVNTQLRLTAALLPELAERIRSRAKGKS
jgi:non-ribosomal peptide synthetase component F